MQITLVRAVNPEQYYTSLFARKAAATSEKSTKHTTTKTNKQKREKTTILRLIGCQLEVVPSVTTACVLPVRKFMIHCFISWGMVSVRSLANRISWLIMEKWCDLESVSGTELPPKVNHFQRASPCLPCLVDVRHRDASVILLTDR